MALDAYLQIDGIKGESADSGHRGWIELTSAQWGVVQSTVSSKSTAGGHTTGHCEHRTIALTKLADMASPLLMQQCSMGKTIPKAKLEFMRADGEGRPVKYYQVELENVLVSHMEQVMRDGGLIEAVRLPFRGYAEAFIGSLRAAGATVNINATYRPPKRAFLMHRAWKIAKGRVKVGTVPAMDGVPISWEHYDKDNKFSDTLSVEAAREMVCEFQMERLGVAPSLKSRHTAGCGIDMTISWTGNLLIRDAFGELIKIEKLPRTGMNTQLHRVGAGFGVIKYNRSGRDDPHWSDTGA